MKEINLRSNTINHNGKEYLLKKDHSFWVSIFLLILLLSVFVGLNTGFNLTVKQTNKELYNIYEELGYIKYLITVEILDYNLIQNKTLTFNITQ